MMRMLMIVAAVLVAGCLEEQVLPDGTSKSQMYTEYDITIRTIRGHDYIIMSGTRKGGIIHAASCPCNTMKGV